ncbi:sporulation protein YqfD [Paenibacillus thalictri]|uniref:Sporulation protein YqfD n=1 Tax=Paenibacillus thalictri TaxID=2527873 RepID=A0A4Q9DC16_9BACL|nr:sporulation protein YqfD [Paenibacillus thalictri]TBL67606.1 sporulation protein YqfD [Paenibacillus thalictri]
MNLPLLTKIRGYVHIELKGSRLHELINSMAQKQLNVWDIGFVEGTSVRLHISLGDFFRLRPLLKQTGSRVHVLARYGLPFLLDKLGKRKFFVAGLIGFVIGIYMLSSVIWQVRVEGNATMATEAILQAAKQTGIYQLQWKYRLKDPDVLARQLQSALPDAAWVGVEIHGTHVVIKVVESKLPDQKPLSSPRHLVASKNALITSIFADKGKPLVKVNTYVRKGDILISGIIGDDVNRQAVVASGKVKGLVWYTPQIESPLAHYYQVYTGAVKKRFYLVIGGRALQLYGFGKPSFEQYESVPELHELKLGNWTLPVGWLKERVMEKKLVEQPVDPKLAKQYGLEQARNEILTAAGSDAKVVSEKILHEKTENGKVYMEAHFEVEEYITEELPIVP